MIGERACPAGAGSWCRVRGHTGESRYVLLIPEVPMDLPQPAGFSDLADFPYNQNGEKFFSENFSGYIFSTRPLFPAGMREKTSGEPDDFFSSRDSDKPPGF